MESSTVSDIKGLMPVTISIDDAYPFTTLYKVKLYCGDLPLGRGELIWDSCHYNSATRSRGKIMFDGSYDGPDSSYYYQILVEESRAPAVIMSIGEPYFIDYYDFEPDGEPYIAGQLGPFSDTVFNGTGLWRIVSSTNPILKHAAGTLVFSADARWVTRYRVEYPRITDIYYSQFPAYSTLKGHGVSVSSNP